MTSASAASPKANLLSEAQRHLSSSQFIYLYSELRTLAGAGYAPFSLDDIRCDHGHGKRGHAGCDGIRTDQIFANLLRTLRKEDRGDPDGLLASLSTYSEVFDMKRLDESIAASLLDRGDPVEVCTLNSKPLKAAGASHQHVGSKGNCLCNKFGMHNTQVMIDHLVRSEDEKRAREAVESKLRPPRGSKLAEAYEQFFCQPVTEEPATAEGEQEDEQIDSLDDDILLSALKDQLKPNSSLANALENEYAVVHINDQWPTKECVYTISCGQTENVVKVTFRGTVSLENWIANLTATREMMSNPVKEEYEGRTDKLGMHKGISNYLFRRRKDTGKSKLDEILEEVNARGNERFGNKKFQLIATGHSLGGALATIFGFYASADERLDANPNLFVDVFSFCAPCVGGVHFARAFQRQEKSRRLRHFRFFDERDIVPRNPTHHLWDGFGDIYTHVGIGISIPGREKDVDIQYNYGDDLQRHRRWLSSWHIEFLHRSRRTVGMIVDLVRADISAHSLDVMLAKIHNIQEKMSKEESKILDRESLYEKYVYDCEGPAPMKHESICTLAGCSIWAAFAFSVLILFYIYQKQGLAALMMFKEITYWLLDVTN